MSNRSTPTAAPTVALTKDEMDILDHAVSNLSNTSPDRNLSHYVIKIARLGGYLARSNEPQPGNIAMWRGLSRLTDLMLGSPAIKEMWVIEIRQNPDRTLTLNKAFGLTHAQPAA